MMASKLIFSVLVLSANFAPSLTLSGFGISDDLRDIPTATASPLVKGNQDLEQSLHSYLTSNRLLKTMRPYGDEGDGRTQVSVNIFVRDVQMERANPEDKSREVYNWSADVVLRQRWNDSRLAYDRQGNYPQYEYFPLNSITNVWTPDIFIPEAASGEFHTITAPNVLLWIYPDGRVLYTRRMTLHLRCVRPAGEHSSNFTCPVNLVPYAHTADKVSLSWDEQYKVELNGAMYIPHFQLQNVTTQGAEVPTRFGPFSRITASFNFRRSD